MQPKIDVPFFFIFFLKFSSSLSRSYFLCRSVSFCLFFQAYLINWNRVFIRLWTVCQIDFSGNFLSFGHWDRSETHPAYLPTFSVKFIIDAYRSLFLSLSHSLFTYTYILYTFTYTYAYTYIFFFFSSCVMNGACFEVRVRMLSYSRCGKYTKKKKKEIQVKGCLIFWCSDRLVSCSSCMFECC